MKGFSNAWATHRTPTMRHTDNFEAMHGITRSLQIIALLGCLSADPARANGCIEAMLESKSASSERKKVGYGTYTVTFPTKIFHRESVVTDE